MKIDTHAHFYPEPYLKELLAYAERLPGPQGEDLRRVAAVAKGYPPSFSVDALLQALDKFGVDLQVLSLSIPNVYFEDKAMSVSLCQLANDFYLDLSRKYPTRFRTFLSVPLQFPDEAVAELDRLAGEPEVAGVILGANIDGAPLNSPQFLPFYAELERRNLPFFIHPMRPPGIEAMMEFNLAPICGYMFDTTLAAFRLVFQGVFEKHARLQMIMPHVGGTAPYLLGRAGYHYSKFDHVRQNISAPPETYFKRFHYDTVCHSIPALHFACSYFGVDHLLFGTDLPFCDDPDVQAREIEELGLSAEDEEAIFSKNAIRLLRLKLD